MISSPLLLGFQAALNTACTPFDGQSGSLRGLKLFLLKWRCLVPGERRDGAQSRPPAGTLGRVLRKRKPLGAGTMKFNKAEK